MELSWLGKFSSDVCFKLFFFQLYSSQTFYKNSWLTLSLDKPFKCLQSNLFAAAFSVGTQILDPIYYKSLKPTSLPGPSDEGPSCWGGPGGQRDLPSDWGLEGSPGWRRGRLEQWLWCACWGSSGKGCLRSVSPALERQSELLATLSWAAGWNWGGGVIGRGTTPSLKEKALSLSPMDVHWGGKLDGGFGKVSRDSRSDAKTCLQTNKVSF